MKLFFFFVLALISMKVLAQKDTLQLNEVTVTANIIQTELKNTARNITIIDKKTIEVSPVKTLDGILQYGLNVDVRSRLSPGVQGDISIRGGHYDQTLILVDGMKVNDPQTGHHSLNIPVPFSMIEKIEVLEGGASRVFGPSAFSGVINIITKKENKNNLELTAGYGQFNTWQSGINATWQSGINATWHKTNSGFSGAFEYGKSGGYIPASDYKKGSGFLKFENRYKKGTINLIYSQGFNDFGASNAYHPKYFNQYEETGVRLMSGNWQHRFSNNLTAQILVNHRVHKDLFDFDGYRDKNLNAFINFHKTNVFDADWKFKLKNKVGQSAFGVEYRNEVIASNRLGQTLDSQKRIKGWPGQFYTQGESRNHLNVFAERNLNFNRVDINFGALLNFNKSFGYSLYPGADIGFHLSPNTKVYFSTNRSLRFPTFTELYLNNSTVVGNPQLKPESAWLNESGIKTKFKNYDLGLTVFYTQTYNAIDKIKYPAEPTPVMANLDRINYRGLETSHSFSFSQNPVKLRSVTFNYAYTYADKKEEGFQSFYTLNYLKHKASAGFFFEPVQKLTFSLWYTYKDRSGQYAWDNQTPPEDYKPFSLVDVRLAYQFRNIHFTMDGNNLFDVHYFEHGFVQQPPRWVNLGLKYAI